MSNTPGEEEEWPEEVIGRESGLSSTSDTGLSSTSDTVDDWGMGAMGAINQSTPTVLLYDNG